MNRLVRLPPGHLERGATSRPGSGVVGPTGGFVDGPGNRVVKAESFATSSAPYLWTRGSLYHLNLEPDLPPAGGVGYAYPTLDDAVGRFFDGGWGAGNTLLRESRLLVISPGFPVSDGAGGEFYDPTPLGEWVRSVFAVSFKKRRVTVVVAGSGPLEQDGGGFAFGVPYSSVAEAANTDYDAAQPGFTHTREQVVAADPAKYRGGEFLRLTVCTNRVSAATQGAGYATAYQRETSPGSGVFETVHVAFNDWAADDLAQLTRGAARFSKFRHVFLQADRNDTPAIPDGLFAQQMANSPHLARRLFAPLDQDAVKQAILAEVGSFWP